jgi:hypothetical protein
MWKKLFHPRMGLWIIVSVLVIGIIAAVASQQLAVMLYKVSLVTLGAVIAYFIDRSLFKNMDANLGGGTSLRDVAAAARMLSRALVFVAVVLGLSLGV